MAVGGTEESKQISQRPHRRREKEESKTIGVEKPDAVLFCMAGSLRTHIAVSKKGRGAGPSYSKYELIRDRTHPTREVLCR